MEEYFDILDKDGNLTGEKRTSFEVHATGLTHRTVHVWLVNSKKEVLVQKRSLKMRAFPNYWDISAAGHVSSGESSIEAAMRETREELGLSLPKDAFTYLFTIKEYFEPDDGRYKDDEFQDVYLVQSDIEVTEMTLQETEVPEVRWLSLTEFESWVHSPKELLVPHQQEHERLLKQLHQY